MADFSGLLNALSSARAGGGPIRLTWGGQPLSFGGGRGVGGGIDPDLIRRIQGIDTQNPVPATGPLRAPETWNFGESLLNLLTLGSSPVAGMGRTIADAVETNARFRQGTQTVEDEARIQRYRDNPLALAGDSVNAVLGGFYGGIGDTLAAVTGQGPSSRVPTWAENYARIQQGGADAGWWDQPVNEPGLFGIGGNDAALAAGGIATDILTDPTTYLTLGLSGLVKGALSGAARAGTVGGRAAVRAGQAAELGVPAGTVLDRAVTRGDRLAGALEGAGEGFRSEAGQFWIGDLVKASRARRAARAGGVTALGADEGLQPANAVSRAARQLEDEAAASSAVGDRLGFTNARGAAQAQELAAGADTAADLGAAAARGVSDEIDALSDDLLGNVSRETASPIAARAAEAWGSTLAKAVPTFTKGTQRALRATKPFEAKPVATPITSLGAKGEKDAMGALVSFWKQSRSGKPLSRPRQALKPQLDALARTRIPLAKLGESYPELARILQEAGVGRRTRAASATVRSTVDAADILDILASDRLGKAVRTLERGGRNPDIPATTKLVGAEERLARLMSTYTEGSLHELRAADAQARQLLGDLAARTASKAMKGASELSPVAQRAEWVSRLRTLLGQAKGEDATVGALARQADELADITDPAELAERLDQIASSVHLAAHRGPKDFFGYIARIPAREVLQRISGQGIRDFARLIGLPVKGNGLTVLKGLRENGYVAYKEAVEGERLAARAFGETQVAGHDLIDDGVRALGDDIQPVKAQLMRAADTAFRDLEPDDAEAVFAALGGRGEGRERGALRENLWGRPENLDASKAGETFIRTQIDGRDRVLIQRFEDQAQYQAFSRLVRHFAAKADALGHTGAARGRYLDEQMMKALGAQDAYLRARGMPPTSRMQDAEKTFRLGGRPGLTHRNEVAFLSLRDVLEEIPQAQRIALLYGSSRASVPPTILHMIGRWAIRRFEAPTPAIAERVLAHRNAFIQHAWKLMGGKAAFSDSNRFGALADQLLSEPDVVARLSEKHIRNAIVARGVWADTAAGASMAVRDAFRKAMFSESLPAGAKIEDLLSFSANITKALDQAGIEDELVHSMAQLDASVLAGETVGPDLFYAARRSEQARQAEKLTESGGVMTDADFIRFRETQADAEVAAAARRAGEAGGVGRLKETMRTRRGRVAEAEASRRFLDDAEPDVKQVTDGQLKAMQASGQEVGALDAAAVRYDAQMQLGFSNRFLQGFLAKFKRGYGMDDLWPLYVRAQFAPVQMTARFGRGLAQVVEKWGSSTAPALVSGWKLLQRVSAEPDGFRVMSDYMDALRAANTTGAAQEGVQEAREALLGTLARVGSENAGDEALEAAVDLWPAVSEVFDPSVHGLFARAGNDADDLNSVLRTFQRKDPDGKPLPLYGGFQFTINGTAGDLGPAWRMIGAGGEAIDPIEILRSTHAALQHATAAPTIAASFSKEFGHASGFGLTRAEALAQGWRLPYEQSDVRLKPFVKYVDPTQLYHPDHLSQLRYLDDLLQGVRKPGPFLQKLFEITDPIVQTMKSSITIWRPGHWMTNIMGEAWMNLFAGVTNPARYVEATGLMARNHRMVKPDLSFFDDYLARNAPAGMAPKPIDIDAPGVDLMLGGGMKHVPDDLLYRGMEQRGIVLSHVQADDVAFDAERQAIQYGQRKPLQGIRDANAALGRASVARDSVFRVAHALDVMRKGSYRNLDEALDAAARAVHKWHPSYQTLTPTDQVYTRRVLYFYTWMRQAVSRMIELSLNSPSVAVLPSRVQYAIAYANGLDPESPGSPVAGDLQLPDYLANSLTGSAFQVGGRVYGMSLNAPTLDIFQQILSPLDVDPTLSVPDNFANAGGQWIERNAGQMLSPALSLPFAALNNSDPRGEPYDAQGGAAARLQSALDTTGLGYISRITGQSLPGVPRADTRTDPTDQEERQFLALINALTGMKFTSQSASNVQSSGERDERERFQRWLDQQAAITG